MKFEFEFELSEKDIEKAINNHLINELSYNHSPKFLNEAIKSQTQKALKPILEGRVEESIKAILDERLHAIIEKKADGWIKRRIKEMLERARLIEKEIEADKSLNISENVEWPEWSSGILQKGSELRFSGLHSDKYISAGWQFIATRPKPEAKPLTPETVKEIKNSLHDVTFQKQK